LGVKGPKSKIKEQRTFCRVPHREMTSKKWLDSIEKPKRRIDLKEHRDKQTCSMDTYTQTDINDKKIIDS